MAPTLFGVLWTKSTLSYGLLAFAISLLHSVYVSLYTDYYLRAQRFDLRYFAIGQLVYAVWNSVNDLGFGFWNDTSGTGMRRTKQIRRGGPLWAISFACLWLPLGSSSSSFFKIHPAIQYTAMMVVYDGFFSYTTVAFRALLADMSQSAKEREDCNVAAAVFHFVAAGYVGIASYFYESSSHHHVTTPGDDRGGGGDQYSGGGRGEVVSALDLTTFRYFTVVTAIISALVFLYATSHIKENSDYGDKKKEAENTEAGGPNSPLSEKEMTLKEFVYETFGDGGQNTPPSLKNGSGAQKENKKKKNKSRTVPLLMVVWFLQEYSCSFATNFFPLFLSMSTATYLGSTVRAAILVVSFAAPHVITVFVTTPLIRRVGRKSTLSGLFGWRLVVAVVALAQWGIWGGQNSFIHAMGFTLLLLLNRVLTEAVCRLQPLIAADAIDEDYLHNDRSVTMGGAIHGLFALASKPAQSLVPVLGCFYLLHHHVSVADAGGGPTAADPKSSSSLVNSDSIDVLRFFFATTCIVTSASLWVVWRQRYSVDKDVAEFQQRHQISSSEKKGEFL